jgi:hypothetical protein
VHALAVAADTMIATALAGSLFFSIPTGEARGRVALYLLLTMAPFAVVAPLIGPALDRIPGGRRAMVIGTTGLRAIVCVFMAAHVDSLLLFPEAFLVLVLSKSYAIAKSALVPTVVDTDDELVSANARLQLLGGVVGFAAALPGIALLQLGGEWTLGLAAVVSVAAAVMATNLPRTQVAPDDAGADEVQELQGRGVIAAATGMGLLRGAVGFLTFLVAFDLRGGGDDGPVPVGLALGRAVRSAAGYDVGSGTADGVPAWQFGVVLAASVVGALTGASLAPRLRQVLSEERMLLGMLAATVGGGLLAALRGGVPGAAIVAFVVGLAAAAAKLAFDAIVQRDAPDANRGRSFARFETRFQLLWVIGAFVPVVVPIPARVGYLVVAGAAAFAAFTYLAATRGGVAPTESAGMAS